MDASSRFVSHVVSSDADGGPVERIEKRKKRVGSVVTGVWGAAMWRTRKRDPIAFQLSESPSSRSASSIAASVPCCP